MSPMPLGGPRSCDMGRLCIKEPFSTVDSSGERDRPKKGATSEAARLHDSITRGGSQRQTSRLSRHEEMRANWGSERLYQQAFYLRTPLLADSRLAQERP